jgi:hypothetical protein
MADHTITIDPAGTLGEPDFTDVFPTVNHAIFNIAADIDLGLAVDVNILAGGDAFSDDLTFGTAGPGSVTFNFVDRSPGWRDPPAGRNAHAHVGPHVIVFSFRNVTINGWMGYGTQVKFIVDADFGSGFDAANIVVDGMAQISGAVEYVAIGRATSAATINLTIRNQSLYDCASIYKADATEGAATMVLDIRHSEHGAEAPCWFTKIGAASFTRTLKNYYAYPGGFTDTDGTPTNLDNECIFLESFVGYGLDAQFGGSGHTEIEAAFPPVCIVFPGNPGEDLRRTANSPLRNAGVDAGVMTDFNGTARTATPTIGAFENHLAAEPRSSSLRMGLGISL